MFTEKEIDYLKSQQMAFIATVAPDGQPDASPVGFEFDGDLFYIGGSDLRNTRKYKNVVAGNYRVALVIDDLVFVNPWRPRGICVYGTAELVEREGRFGRGVYLGIIPQVSWSWNVDGLKPHETVHPDPYASLAPA